MDTPNFAHEQAGAVLDLADTLKLALQHASSLEAKSARLEGENQVLLEKVASLEAAGPIKVASAPIAISEDAIQQVVDYLKVADILNVGADVKIASTLKAAPVSTLVGIISQLSELLAPAPQQGFAITKQAAVAGQSTEDENPWAKVVRDGAA